MSMFRSKKLDLGGFVNIKVIRDHTKRKVFAEHEPERYYSSLHCLDQPSRMVVIFGLFQCILMLLIIDKHFDM
jgi:hypothetical protein